MIIVLRKKKKYISVFLIAIIFQAILPPDVFALSTGPEQVEYSSYESGESSDLVNLLTGDFSYTMPVMDVPSPEGNFSLPLFYHAGITTEQDASWVGLGFNLNAGCISRDIAGYPDDAFDSPLSVNVNDPGGSGWVKNYVFYKRTWDSEKGYGGGISIFDIVGVEWENSTGLKTGTLGGFTFNKNGVKGYWAENVISSANAAIALYSLGTSFAGGGAAVSAQEAAMDVVSTAVTTAASLYQGYLSQGTFSSRFNQWNQETKVSSLGFKVKYKYWLDDTRTERAFGSLYLGSTYQTSMSSTYIPPDYNHINGYISGTDWPRIYTPSLTTMPVVKGFPWNGTSLAASDMYINVDQNQNYADVTSSTHIAYDDFQVMSPGVSGNISPYRLEIGSLSQPKRYSYSNRTQNLVPYIEEDNASNKVQFFYRGQFSNKYLYHDDNAFGIDQSVATEGDGRNYVYLDITNNKLKTTASRVESDNSRINGKRIVSGKHVSWYTNQEISSGSAVSQGFIDDVGMQSIRASLPQKGIGGFSITGEDGKTYHYAVPVYRHKDINFIGKNGEQEVKYSKSVDNSDVAITWLLTAITGPDFIDRGQSGILDDNDWGYWTKFNYGTTTNKYAYRFPYYGYFGDSQSYRYSVGARDEYYLNSIETRSHVAIFIKGVRTDGLSSYKKSNNANFYHSREANDGELSVAIPKLYLDEIALLNKADFNSITSQGFNSQVNTSPQYQPNFNTAQVFDVGDINASNRAFLDSKSLRRVKFVYETDDSKKLCKKSLNSFPDPNNPPAADATDIYLGKNGKLTLNRVQVYGRNSSKVMPDYIFEYGFNPDYNKDAWDGWGYYNLNGASVSHRVSQTDQDGAAWSLSKLILPTGGTLQVDYQRDAYLSVSGEPIWEGEKSYSKDSYSLPFDQAYTTIPIDNADNYFTVNMEVKLSGLVTFRCNSSSPYITNDYSGDYAVVGSTSTSVTLGGDCMGIASLCPGGTGSTLVDFYSNSGTLAKAVEKKGGDIRVSTITFKNEFGDLTKTKYSYTDGVVSKEPEFIRSGWNPNNFGLDNIYDYPFTPVLYGKVSVENGYNNINNTYSIKQVYNFEVPNKNLVREINTTVKNYQMPGYEFITSNGLHVSQDVSFKQYLNRVDVRNAKIGKIKSIKTFDSKNPLVETESLNFSYTEAPPNDQGKYTTGSILSEFTSSGSFTDSYSMRLLRTIKTYYPYVLSRITYAKDGFTQTKDYKSWDFYTGIPLITDSKSSLGQNIREEKVPAYTAYPEMGLKGLNNSNRNMLSQFASSYTYGIGNDGNIDGLISANAQTWKKDWGNYRVYNNTTKVYEDAVEGVNLWRKNASYSWVGTYSRLQQDGSQRFSNVDKFSFVANATNTGWKKLSELSRYNHFNNLLEAKDINDINYSSKFGYNNSMKIAQASNAKFEEIAFSGAEDGVDAFGYFGGEVALKDIVGDAQVVLRSSGANVHTGNAALSMSVGHGFMYKTNALISSRKYKASVWTNNINGRIYYKTNGSPTDVVSASPTVLVGNWYLLSVEIPIGATSIEVGVKSAGGVVSFDDFRFQPVDASMACYVYDTNIQALSFVLGNDNTYKMFEYNDQGILIKTYQETLSYGVKLISESKYDFRRFHFDQ